MNIFFAPPSQIHDQVIELTGQEAIHATKALRYKEGDDISVVDGKGTWYKGTVQLITKKTVRIIIDQALQKNAEPQAVLAIGMIKKRDRLEFAVEKAVELGVGSIAIFRGEHSVKQNLRLDRVKAAALSAMKQSLQTWLPKVQFHPSLNDVFTTHPECMPVAARQGADQLLSTEILTKNERVLFLVGPEGGFSESEMQLMEEQNVQFVSLGSNRLRAETAAVTLLNHYHYCKLLR